MTVASDSRASQVACNCNGFNCLPLFLLGEHGTTFARSIEIDQTWGWFQMFPFVPQPSYPYRITVNKPTKPMHVWYLIEMRILCFNVTHAINKLVLQVTSWNVPG